MPPIKCLCNRIRIHLGQRKPQCIMGSLSAVKTNTSIRKDRPKRPTPEPTLLFIWVEFIMGINAIYIGWGMGSHCLGSKRHHLTAVWSFIVMAAMRILLPVDCMGVFKPSVLVILCCAAQTGHDRMLRLLNVNVTGCCCNFLRWFIWSAGCCPKSCLLCNHHASV